VRAVLALLILAGMLPAQEAAPAAEEHAPPPVRELTFMDAVELGLAYNLGLKSARVDALIARLEVGVQEAAWDFTLDSALTGGETLIPARTQLEGATVLDRDDWNFNVGLTKPFRLGPTLGLEWRSDRTFSNSSFNTINPAYESSFAVNVTVPLLRGRGRGAQEADLRASEAGALGARFSLLDKASEMILQVAQAYWNLVYLQDRVGVLEKSLEVAQEIEDAERRKLRPEIGRSTQLDVTQAHAQTKSREADLIKGRFDAANAADDLRLLILPFTGSEGDRVVVRAVERPQDDVALTGLAEMVATALDQRPDLRASDTEIQRRQEAVVKAEDALRVQLDLGGNVTWRGVDSTLGSSASPVVEGSYPSAAGTLSLTWTLGRRAAKATLQQAQLAVEQARINRRDQVNGIIVEVRRAHRAVRAALEAITALQEEVAAAQASLEGERQRLARGSATVLDVAQLESNLTESRLRLLETRTTLAQARMQAYRVTGTLLKELRLELGTNYEIHRIRE